MSWGEGEAAYPLGEATATADTGKAILVVLHDMDDRERWIPRAVIHSDSKVREQGDEGELVVKTWWADKQAWM